MEDCQKQVPGSYHTKSYDEPPAFPEAMGTGDGGKAHCGSDMSVEFLFFSQCCWWEQDSESPMPEKHDMSFLFMTIPMLKPHYLHQL